MLYALAFAGGYVACIYTWPKVKEIFIGAEAEAAKLRLRALDLETKARGLVGK